MVLGSNSMVWKSVRCSEKKHRRTNARRPMADLRSFSPRGLTAAVGLRRYSDMDVSPTPRLTLGAKRSTLTAAFCVRLLQDPIFATILSFHDGDDRTTKHVLDASPAFVKAIHRWSNLRLIPLPGLPISCRLSVRHPGERQRD